MCNYNTDYLYSKYRSEYDYFKNNIDKISYFIIDGLSGYIIVDEVCVRGRCSGKLVLSKIINFNWHIDNSDNVVINSDNKILYKLNDVLMEIYDLKMKMLDLFERMLILQ